MCWIQREADLILFYIYIQTYSIIIDGCLLILSWRGERLLRGHAHVGHLGRLAVLLPETEPRELNSHCHICIVSSSMDAAGDTNGFTYSGIFVNYQQLFFVYSLLYLNYYYEIL